MICICIIQKIENGLNGIDAAAVFLYGGKLQNVLSFDKRRKI